MEYPKVINKTTEEINRIIEVIKNSGLPIDIINFILPCIKLAIWFPIQLQSKNISLRRMRAALFGKGVNRKKGEVAPEEKPKKEETAGKEPEEKPKEEETLNKETEQATPKKSASNSKKPGHGRMPHTVYQNYTAINLFIEGLKAGDFCPEQCGGKLRLQGPGTFVHILGQNFAKVEKYFVEKLRCDLCGKLISAVVSPELKEKYHSSFKSIVVLQKYYLGMPFYRQQYFQQLIGFKLSDSTQWDLVEQVAGCCYLIFNLLKKLAANGKKIANDDTLLKILEVMREKGRQRKGMFTTGVVAEWGKNKIVLFINGTQHAGENLTDILAQREAHHPPIIQMSDASSSCVPKKFTAIIYNPHWSCHLDN